MLVITTQVAGVDKLTQRARATVIRLKDAAPILGALEADFREHTKKRFLSAGPGWQPLAPSTVARKARLGLDPRILIATGDLMQSMTQAGSKYSVRRIGPDSVTIGTTRPGASAHQDSQRAWLPVRRFAVVDSPMRAGWVKIIDGKVAGIVRQELAAT